MRPPRLLVILSSFIAVPVLFTFITLLTSHRAGRGSEASSKRHGSGFSTLFSFHSPSSLFPPSALISLTDDNSTFFLARPAAFGPALPSSGLSGQLWIGSGFGDDTLGRGLGASLRAEGELGCSDVPGWDDGKHTSKHTAAPGSTRPPVHDPKVLSDSQSWIGRLRGHHKRSVDTNGVDPPFLTERPNDPSKNDGTDDHLHHPALPTYVEDPSADGSSPISQTPRKTSQHADIESLQQGAEISGKVVLLSRGGCGFLEKVKWTQRRGGVALIVGDDTRGGGLVTMYAQGDTSNITIPAVFTAHTTAHLLSSLIPSDGKEEGAASGESRVKADRRRILKSGRRVSNKGAQNPFSTQRTDRPTFTPTLGDRPPVATSRSSEIGNTAQRRQRTVVDSPFQAKERPGWLRCLLFKFGIGSESMPLSALGGESRRPPSSGQLEWTAADVPTEKEKIRTGGGDEGIGLQKHDRPSAASTSARHPASTVVSSQPAGGEFVIGVQDWRDPDLLEFTVPTDGAGKSGVSSKKVCEHVSGSRSDVASAVPTASTLQRISSGKAVNGPFEGGSIIPGSGQYGEPKTSEQAGTTFNLRTQSLFPVADESCSHQTRPNGWLARLWRHSSMDRPEGKVIDVASTPPLNGVDMPHDSMEGDGDDESAYWEEGTHDGLWLTLTPTTMSTSPFFDTLLVLVVSPLATLTVVYGMLLLRSRIRRRRWRAPKSVVERLPVRTYHTISSATQSSSSQATTPGDSSPTSPLLQTQLPELQSSRPRSQTASSVLMQGEVPRSRPVSVRGRNTLSEHEKSKSASPVWRRRYSGRQMECVVCLEEYVDGLSQVMSLPCGHEFHASCITPWLTTRRRTCPICKGDVVRSLARGSCSDTDHLHPPEASDEDAQDRSADVFDRSVTTPIPITRDVLDSDDHDLERGADHISGTTRLDNGGSSWTNLNPLRHGSLRGFAVLFGLQPASDRPDEAHQ